MLGILHMLVVVAAAAAAARAITDTILLLLISIHVAVYSTGNVTSIERTSTKAGACHGKEESIKSVSSQSRSSSRYVQD